MERIKILCKKIDDKHAEAFWYYGKQIATFSTWVVESAGEIKVSFDGKSYKNEAAVKEALLTRIYLI